MIEKFMLKILLILLLTLTTLTSNAALLIDKINGFSLTKNSIQTIVFGSSKKLTVVIFLSKDCPCSKGNLGYLNELSKEFKDVQFIGVHSKKGTKAEEVATYLQDKNLSFDIFIDSDLKIADQFKALKTPHVFVLNSSGEIVYNGGVTNTTVPTNAKEHYLKNTLLELQSNTAVSHPETRTLGCFITR